MTPDDINAASILDPMPAIPAKLLYTPREAAALLSLSRTTLYELMGSGALAFIRIGRARRLPASSLETFVQGSLAREGFLP